jgi:hypothetical protein
MFNIRQKSRKQPDERQERAHFVDCVDPEGIGQLAQDGGADASHPEGEAKEQPCDRAGTSRQQLLRVAGLSLLGHRAERKSLVFRGRGVKGLPYICAAIFAAVIRGGACGGSVQPSLASSIC